MTKEQFKQVVPIELYKQFNRFLIQNGCLDDFWRASTEMEDRINTALGDELTRSYEIKEYSPCSRLVDLLLYWRGAERASIRTREYWAELSFKLLKEYKKVFSTQIASKIKY